MCEYTQVGICYMSMARYRLRARTNEANPLVFPWLDTIPLRTLSLAGSELVSGVQKDRKEVRA